MAPGKRAAHRGQTVLPRARAQAGWGKPPAYVLAAAATGVADVTGRYTADPDRALARRALCPEAELAARARRGSAGAEPAGLPGAPGR